MAAIKGGFENQTSTLSYPIRPTEPFLPIAIVNFPIQHCMGLYIRKMLENRER